MNIAANLGAQVPRRHSRAALVAMSKRDGEELDPADDENAALDRLWERLRREEEARAQQVRPPEVTLVPEDEPEDPGDDD